MVDFVKELENTIAFNMAMEDYFNNDAKKEYLAMLEKNIKDVGIKAAIEDKIYADYHVKTKDYNPAYYVTDPDLYSRFPLNPGGVISVPLQEKPLDKQVGGTHYKTFAIQPAEYNERNKIGFLEGNVIKYVSRWRSKDGIKDLEKAKHCIDILIELNADLPRS